MLEPLDGTLFGDDQPCFGCAPNHPIGFKLAFEHDGDDVVTRFTPDERYQGPPGIMHGGLVMTLADEIAAWAIIAKLETFGFTSSVECKLKRPIRIGTPIEGRGTILKQGRRVIDTSVMISQHDEVACQATLRFVMLDPDAAEKLIGAPMPEAWRRFGRGGR